MTGSGPRFKLLPVVRQDIRDVLAFTRDRWGVAKAQQYAALIRQALRVLASTPTAGPAHRRQEIHADAWVYPISKPGQRARHILLYEIVNDKAQVYGFLYDGMHLPEQWGERQP